MYMHVYVYICIYVCMVNKEQNIHTYETSLHVCEKEMIQ